MNAMASEALFDLIPTNTLPVMLSLLACVLALVAILSLLRLKRDHQQRYESLRQRADTLWRELDDLRVDQTTPFTSPALRDGKAATETSRYLTEKEAYDRIWPQVWQLHDRLGLFLRAVESGEPVGDLRLETRNTAIEARNLLNRNRPYCCQQVDELATRLIDTEIPTHLAACQYVDLVKEASTTPSTHDRRALQEKCQHLHEGEARELLQQLTEAVRSRMIT